MKTKLLNSRTGRAVKKIASKVTSITKGRAKKKSVSKARISDRTGLPVRTYSRKAA